MKIIFKVFFVFLFIIMFKSSNVFAFSGGDGSSSNPYQISTKQDLKDIGSVGSMSASYILMNDIDISGSNWEPLGTTMGPFTGTLNGNNFSISGLTYVKTLDYNLSNTAVIGLFTYISNGIIFDLNLKDVNINLQVNEVEDIYVGALAGGMQHTEIETGVRNVSVDGLINIDYVATDSVSHIMHFAIGGLVGSYNGSTDEQYTSLDQITSTMYIGVFVVDTVPNDSIFTYLGGITGISYNTGIKNSSYYGNEISTKVDPDSDASTIELTTHVGGMSGLVMFSLNQTHNIFEGNQVGDSSIETNLIGFNSVGGLAGKIYAANFSDIENCVVKNTTVSGVMNVGGFVGEMEKIRIFNAKVLDLNFEPNTEQDHSNFGGLVGYANFSFISGADIKNISMSGSADYIGGAVGSSFTSDYEKITVDNIKLVGYYNGGLIGSSTGSASISFVEVTNADLLGGTIGGILGYSQVDTFVFTLSNSYFSGTIDGDDWVGGLIGNSYNGKFILTNVYSLGKIIGGNHIGGLVGGSSYADLNINSAYSRVLLENDAAYTLLPIMGGIVGSSIDGTVKADQVYFAGSVNLIGERLELTSIDPFIGSGSATVTNTYYDAENFILANQSGYAQGKSTKELKTKEAYTGFDFEETWLISESLNDGYAQLDGGKVRVSTYDGDLLIDTLLYQAGSNLDALPDYSKEGYTFEGWYGDQALSLPFEATVLGDSDIKFYAKTTLVKAQFDMNLVMYSVIAGLILIIVILIIVLLGRKKKKAVEKKAPDSINQDQVV